jgi:hypothetical protein
LILYDISGDVLLLLLLIWTPSPNGSRHAALFLHLQMYMHLPS